MRKTIWGMIITIKCWRTRNNIASSESPHIRADALHRRKIRAQCVGVVRRHHTMAQVADEPRITAEPRQHSAHCSGDARVGAEELARVEIALKHLPSARDDESGGIQITY